MRYRIHHQTVYKYESSVSYSHHVARLRPSVTPRQTQGSFELKVTPAPDSLSHSIDYFGNACSYFGLTTPHKKLVIDSYSQVTVKPQQSIDLDLSMPWEMVRDILRTSHLAPDLAAAEFTFASPLCPYMPELADYARQSFQKDVPILQASKDLTSRIFKDFKFDPKVTTVATPVSEVFEKRAGVCQDFSHFQISCLRSLGLAAAYVSGYLRTEPPPGKERLIGADASHAWVSIYAPQIGWTGFDATNNVLPGQDHIHVAKGRDYLDISPVRGTVFGGGTQTLNIGVTVSEDE
ncbi:transglutaminase family protein [Roseibacillus persicicus]|uniref:Transglutaminase n=1 Tax=Roseibacillus persicicus TaxID=454148 RepID=A0A918WJU6_9BACT|nr:transglutaminase family protein [Roseibacillus persicicus]MDQ8190823.1 transglutaminase family protein [Roseibacillus persicicus]GHC54230.1 transglutaminase [Roseibacillus persicicus]